MTITEFLTARLNEDESVARYLLGGKTEPAEVHDTSPHSGVVYGMWIYDDDHSHDTLAVDPARVLAEVEAKRRIIDLEHRDSGVGTCSTCYAGPDWPSGWPCDTIKSVAAVYANHPDYQQEWAP